MTEPLIPYLDLASADERATDADLAKVQAYFKAALPKPFATLQRQYGPLYLGDLQHGGLQFDIDWRRIDGAAVSDAWSDELLGSDVIDTMHSIQDILSSLEDWDELVDWAPPAGAYLPFAETHEAHMLMISMVGPAAGQVFAWYAGQWRWGEDQGAFIGFVADSFEDFFSNRLYQPPYD